MNSSTLALAFSVIVTFLAVVKLQWNNYMHVTAYEMGHLKKDEAALLKQHALLRAEQHRLLQFDHLKQLSHSTEEDVNAFEAQALASRSR